MRTLGFAGPLVLCLAAAVTIVACGSVSPRTLTRAQPSAAHVQEGITLATRAVAGDFPATRHRTLRQIGMRVAGGPQLEISTSVLEPGRDRLAYNVIDSSNGALLGRSAVYIAAGLDAPARGPFPAAGESLIVDPSDRSSQGVSVADPTAFTYIAQIPVRTAGPLAVLAVVRQGSQLTGGVTATQVTQSPSLPAPRVHTDILRTANDDLAKLDTRTPHADMHRTDLARVLSHRPVVLLFASPLQCPSRLGGPVVDMTSSLERRYRDRVAFIHQEVYNPDGRGLTAATRAFGLPTQPWLFTIDRHGRIAARLEGAVGHQEFDAAIRRALR